MARPICAALVIVIAILAACTSDEETKPDPTEEEIVAAWIDAGLTPDAAGCVVDLLPDRLSPTEQLDAASTPDEFDDLVGACEEATSPGPTSTVAPPPDDEPFAYGDDTQLDGLWDACSDGSGAACDELFELAPPESEYEQFGLSCGDRPEILNCSELDGVTTTVAAEGASAEE